jgi:hypothetical protein
MKPSPPDSDAVNRRFALLQEEALSFLTGQEGSSFIQIQVYVFSWLECLLRITCLNLKHVLAKTMEAAQILKLLIIFSLTFEREAT